MSSPKSQPVIQDPVNPIGSPATSSSGQSESSSTVQSVPKNVKKVNIIVDLEGEPGGWKDTSSSIASKLSTTVRSCWLWKYCRGGSGSATLKDRFHNSNYTLTRSVDRTYLRGKPGVTRVLTMVVAMIAASSGFPGYSTDNCIKVGFGNSGYIVASIIFMNFAIIISVGFLYLLLNYREVRYTLRWDEINLKAHSAASFLCTMSGLMELIGIYYTRRSNCVLEYPDDPDDAHFFCLHNGGRHTHHIGMHTPDLGYKEFHYVSTLTKFISATLYAVCARNCLKNDDKV